MATTSIRIDPSTHGHLERLAADRGATIEDTVALAVQALRQAVAGTQLATPLHHDETTWLDADLG